MLTWALFTVGSLLGVFVTLKVFVVKERVSEYRQPSEFASRIHDASSEWEVHEALIQPNKQISSQASAPNVVPQAA